MKRLIFLVLILLPLTVFNQKAMDIESLWKVSGTSKVMVEGSSNVNDFQCVTLNYEGADELKKFIHHDNGERLLTGAVEMKVRSFDCENRIMTRDLRETLKEQVYPNIVIELQSLRIPESAAQQQSVSGRAKVTIAGTSWELDMSWTLIRENASSMRLLGTHDFSFTQFNIEPPTKMMGMIRVKDEIKVDFDLVMEMKESQFFGE